MDFLTERSKLGRFFNLVFDLVVLHFLWILCSLPLFTIGASTTALYFTFMKRTRRDEGYIWENFFHSFKENFKQSTLLWLIFLVVGAVLYADLRIGLALESSAAPFIVFATALLLIPYTFTLLYIFPVQAKFENTVKDNLKNAFLMSVANLGYTALMLLILTGIVFALLSSKAFIGLFLVCGIGLTAWILSNFFVIIFRKYLPEEYKEDLDATNSDGINY